MKKVALSEVAEVIRGVTFSSEESSNTSLPETLPVIRAGSIQKTLLLDEGLLWVPKQKIKPSQKIRRDDIIICTSSGSADLVGKCAKSEVDFDGSFGAFCAGIRPIKERVSPSYLYHFLCSPNFRNWTSGSSGANIKNIRISELSDFEIPLPQLAEQKRIAAILDKADAIRRKRQQAIQLADDFLRAVFLEMFGDPVTNPKGWEVKLLKDIAKIQIGPFGTQLHKEDYVSDGIPLINPSHIKNSEVVPDFNLTVSETKFEELAEYHLTVGDIIMGRRGEMGRCALIGERESGWLCGTGSLYIRPFIGDAQSFYLFKYLTSDYIKTYLEGESLGATMPNLNKTIVGNIKVPMPSTEAITKFQNILAADRAYREKVTLIDDSLFESLSQKAFSGQL